MLCCIYLLYIAVLFMIFRMELHIWLYNGLSHNHLGFHEISFVCRSRYCMSEKNDWWLSIDNYCLWSLYVIAKFPSRQIAFLKVCAKYTATHIALWYYAQKRWYWVNLAKPCQLKVLQRTQYNLQYSCATEAFEHNRCLVKIPINYVYHSHID